MAAKRCDAWGFGIDRMAGLNTLRRLYLGRDQGCTAGPGNDAVFPDFMVSGAVNADSTPRSREGPTILAGLV